ncbi:MAG: biotin transporter BioY [Alphaproteobacteria bacterium]|nr:biotin transporter BioY [Alphaproteobacteria bacterium]
MTVRTATIADIVWPSRPQARIVRAAALMLLGACLLTLSAKIQIPFWPVPMTMQTLVVLVIGMAYGWRLGAAPVLAYLVAGVAGLPVFAGTPARGIGVAYMMGPTGGYLLGFLVSAAAVGFLGERGWDRSLPRTAVAMVLGQAIIALAGVAWLAILFNLPKAIEVGFKPFLAASLLKVALGIVLMPTIWKLLDRNPAKRAN